MKKVTTYLSKTLPQREQWMLELEAYAIDNRVPIMEPVSMNFLTQLVLQQQPNSILEIGTAIGYSALRMEAVYPNTKILSIEKNAQMCHTARQNIKRMQKETTIQVVEADALLHMEELIKQGKTYDFIFIDAAKAQYKKFFMLADKLIHRHGMIVCDNVLFKGYVADDGKNANPRLQKMAHKIRDFNKWLMQHDDYQTSIVPIGDGLTISVKY